jgi:hypothetical protein
MPTEKINTVKGFDQRLFRLSAKVTECFSAVKSPKGQTLKRDKDLSRYQGPGVSGRGMEDDKTFSSRPLAPDT